MSKADELRARLKQLQKKKEDDAEIKRLEHQVRAEEFSQTTGGKIFNKIGDFGISMSKGLKNVGKAIATPPKQTSKKQVNGRSFDEILAGLPQ